MTEVVSLPRSNWVEPFPEAEQEQAIRALEAGNVLLLPRLSFDIEESEKRLLRPENGDRQRSGAKNISFDPASGVLRGGMAAEHDLLQGMIGRFARLSSALICGLLPRYEPVLQQARTSYRPAEIAGRRTSWRKDDTRLHVDSFPSSPTQGRRILRVFANVHPGSHTRTWRLGESFQSAAERYLPSISPPRRGASLALSLLHVTRSRRSDYDHYMLQLHDRMKGDLAYQERVPQTRYEFAPGTTWMVFTDQVSHAAMSGQYALEQTFHLPVHVMQDPSRSPLRVLESLLGRPLV